MHAIFLYPLYGLLAYLAVMVSAFVAHSTMPSAPPILGFIARSMSAYLALVVCAAYGTLASSILKLLGLHYRFAQWTTARSFKYLGKLMIGVDFNIIDNGEEILNSNRPAVIVGNHQTELDILMLATLFPQYCSVTAKKSLRNAPFLGWFMTLSGTVYIDRVDRTQAMKAFEGAAKTMKEKKQSVFIFPEGTRSYATEPKLLPFKKGAFHLAVQAQVPIIPTVAENYSRILNVEAKSFNSGAARIKVMQPISTKGKTAADVDALMKETREKMLKALEELGNDSQSKMEGKSATKKAI